MMSFPYFRYFHSLPIIFEASVGDSKSIIGMVDGFGAFGINQASKELSMYLSA